MDYSFLIAVIILILGIPIGNLLAKAAREEIRRGQRWLKLVAFLSLIGALIGLVIGNDVVLFTFAFISIVTSRSIR